MSNTLSIFISYARTESAFVDKLESKMTAYGFFVWVDRSQIHAGQEWLDRIENAINKCNVLIIVLSPHAVKSDYVKMEYRHALKKGKMVIPLLSTSCDIPMDLNNIQRIDFQSSFDQGM